MKIEFSEKFQIFIFKVFNMKKIVRLTERDLARIVNRVIKEQIESNQLNSPKGQQTKKIGEFFNKYYKTNLPLDGNWMNPEFNKTMEKYLKEKGIPVYVCKKGDGYCDDDYAGEVTTKEVNKYYDILKQDMSKLGMSLSSSKDTSAKFNTTNDRSYDYKLENGKYYYTAKGQNKWIEAKGKGLESIKTKIKF